jgi:hypothetical protein
MAGGRKLRAAYARIRPRNLAEPGTLLRAIQANPRVSRYGHEYVFGNIEEVDGGEFVTGRMGFPAVEELVEREYDDLLGEFVERTVEHPDAPSGAFVLHLDSGVMASASEKSLSIGTPKRGPNGRRERRHLCFRPGLGSPVSACALRATALRSMQRRGLGRARPPELGARLPYSLCSLRFRPSPALRGSTCLK